jgi:hypothetical protein
VTRCMLPIAQRLARGISIGCVCVLCWPNVQGVSQPVGVAQRHSSTAAQPVLEGVWASLAPCLASGWQAECTYSLLWAVAIGTFCDVGQLQLPHYPAAQAGNALLWPGVPAVEWRNCNVALSAYQ